MGDFRHMAVCVVGSRDAPPPPRWCRFYAVVLPACAHFIYSLALLLLWVLNAGGVNWRRCWTLAACVSDWFNISCCHFTAVVVAVMPALHHLPAITVRGAAACVAVGLQALPPPTERRLYTYAPRILAASRWCRAGFAVHGLCCAALTFSSTVPPADAGPLPHCPLPLPACPLFLSCLPHLPVLPYSRAVIPGRMQPPFCRLFSAGFCLSSPCLPHSCLPMFPCLPLGSCHIPFQHRAFPSREECDHMASHGERIFAHDGVKRSNSSPAWATHRGPRTRHSISGAGVTGTLPAWRGTGGDSIRAALHATGMRKAGGGLVP